MSVANFQECVYVTRVHLSCPTHPSPLQTRMTYRMRTDLLVMRGQTSWVFKCLLLKRKKKSKVSRPDSAGELPTNGLWGFVDDTGGHDAVPVIANTTARVVVVVATAGPLGRLLETSCRHDD